MENFKILEKLVSFNTVKDKDNKEIIDYIEKYLIDYGFKTEYKSKNLIMSIGENPKIGFLGHTDTVKYLEEFKNPFKLKIEGNKVYGLGVCDMKGGIAVILDIIKEIDFSKFKYGMKLYFTYDEEIGFSGIYELVKSSEKFPEYMIFGEPTNNEMLIGSKGLLEFKIDFIGKKVHSSNPDNGINANMNAIKFIYELNDFYENKIKVEKYNRFEIPYTTMNVGIINGGTEINSTAEKCEVLIDFRIAGKEQIELIKKRINELATIYFAKYEVLNSIEPFINELGFINNFKTANFITEASMIDDKVNKIILGLGPITAHEVNENITIESYNKLKEQYKELIYKILG